MSLEKEDTKIEIRRFVENLETRYMEKIRDL